MSITPASGHVPPVAHKRHTRIVQLKAELGRNALEFGLLLAEMQDTRDYQALGFTTFEEYLSSDAVDVKRRTAYVFMNVARKFAHVHHDAHGLDYNKLDILARLIEPGDDPEQVAILVEQAREMPREQLRAAVRVEVERRKETEPTEYVPTLTPPTPLPRPQLMPSPSVSLPTLADVETSEGTYRESVLREQYDGAIGRLLTAARYADDLYRHNDPEEVARLLTEDEEAPDDQTIVAFTRWVQRVIEVRRGIVTIRRA